jgi:alkanesulfonate monooxygenase SsuD/methylene tetrahydromethanopterin reductase-like flavin-dependent oxidoreductase (luciferase family)
MPGLGVRHRAHPFATAIAPIYAQTVEEFAHTAAYIHEVSGGRFQFGIGVAHEPSHTRMGVTPGKPLGDIRAFVAKVRSYDGIGALPPIVLSALRKRMIALAAEIADGSVFANGCLSHMSDSLAIVPVAKRNDPNFFIGNRIRTCICDDEAEAKSVLRRTVANYALMPNYRNYWKEAGYVEEMTAIEDATAQGRLDDVPKYLPRPLACRHHIVWVGGESPRGRRSMARRRHQDPGPGAPCRRRRPDDRVARGVRRLR